MSFYFQPPIFAVQPATYIQPVVWLTTPIPTTPTYTVIQPVSVPHVVYTPSPLWTVHPSPMVSDTASPQQSPYLNIRIIFYGHQRETGEYPSVWCRAADTMYTSIPKKSTLRNDISQRARGHNLRGGWGHARVFVLRAGARGLCIAPGAGAVMNEDVVRVMEVFRDRREGNVSKREFKRVLEESLVVGNVIVVVVCMDGSEGVSGRRVAEHGRRNGGVERNDAGLAQLSTAEGQVQAEDTTAPVSEVNGASDEEHHQQQEQVLVTNGVPPS